MSPHRLREYRERYPVLHREKPESTFVYLLKFGAIVASLYLGILGVDALIH